MSTALPSWDLKELVRHPAKDFQGIEKKLESEITSLERQRIRLTTRISHAAFLQVLKQIVGITELMNTLRAYAFLWVAENTKNQAARAFENQVQRCLAQFSPRLLFLTYGGRASRQNKPADFRFEPSLISIIWTHSLG
jgi:oligoendopeptidase F